MNGELSFHTNSIQLLVSLFTLASSKAMTIYNEKPFGKLDFPSFENLRVVSRLDATVKEKLQKMDLQR